jgi:hypothetical protein
LGHTLRNAHQHEDNPRAKDGHIRRL